MQYSTILYEEVSNTPPYKIRRYAAELGQVLLKVFEYKYKYFEMYLSTSTSTFANFEMYLSPSTSTLKSTWVQVLKYFGYSDSML